MTFRIENDDLKSPDHDWSPDAAVIIGVNHGGFGNPILNGKEWEKGKEHDEFKDEIRGSKWSLFDETKGLFIETIVGAINDADEMRRIQQYLQAYHKLRSTNDYSERIVSITIDLKAWDPKQRLFVRNTQSGLDWKVVDPKHNHNGNNQINNPAQFNQIRKSIARLYTTIKNTK